MRKEITTVEDPGQTTELSFQAADPSKGGADVTTIDPPAAPSHAEIAYWRESAVASGYSIVRVRSGDKAPLIDGWQNGDPGVLDPPTVNAMNTGTLLGVGEADVLAVLDIDCDRQDDRNSMLVALQPWLDKLSPPRLTRFRRTADGVTGWAILLRAKVKEAKQTATAEEHDPKQCRRKFEFLSSGQIVVHGTHPRSIIEWLGNRSPATVCAGMFPWSSQCGSTG